MTSRIRLGVAVAILPLHNPLDLAESYAMADVMSNGRLDFGIGKGSEPVEYRKFGASRDEATQRFMESADIIRQAWSDQPVNFRDEFYNCENVNILPKPVQRPHPPIWVAATRTEETFHAAADPNRKLTNRDIGYDMARGYIIVGDPERCSDTIRRWHEEGGITTFSGTFHFGGMPQEMALKSIRLFAERVMPALRPL